MGSAVSVPQQVDKATAAQLAGASWSAALEARFDAAAAGAPAGWQWSPAGLLTPSYDGLQVPSQVNYVAKALPIFSPGEAVPGCASVITKYLRTAYLWDAVRVQGGAYGCSLGFSRFSGVASFSSYRDPNVATTLDCYDQTGAFLRANPLGPAELSQERERWAHAAAWSCAPRP